MQLRALSQLNVRNLRTPSLSFEPGVVAVVGRNAAGKSNLMAAAYLGCTGELPSGSIAETLRLGESEGYVAVDVAHRDGESRIEVGLAPGRKALKLDGNAVRATDVARVSTAVLLTPEDANLVHGSPAGRRAYLDALLCKVSTRYALLLREYQRVLEQRNALLKTPSPGPTLAVWSDRFVGLGSEIDDLRTRATAAIGEAATAVYGEVAADAKVLRVALVHNHPACDLAQALARSREEERARGVTVVGPHRDDLALTLDGHAVQAFGSRGEARTTGLALRVAEYRLLSEKHGEAPILLVDDFTAELDEGRRAFLLELTASTPQAVVSGTEPPSRYDSLFHVREGEVARG